MFYGYSRGWVGVNFDWLYCQYFASDAFFCGECYVWIPQVPLLVDVVFVGVELYLFLYCVECDNVGVCA